MSNQPTLSREHWSRIILGFPSFIVNKAILKHFSCNWYSYIISSSLKYHCLLFLLVVHMQKIFWLVWINNTFCVMLSMFFNILSCSLAWKLFSVWPSVKLQILEIGTSFWKLDLMDYRCFSKFKKYVQILWDILKGVPIKN